MKSGYGESRIEKSAVQKSGTELLDCTLFFLLFSVVRCQLCFSCDKLPRLHLGALGLEQM